MCNGPQDMSFTNANRNVLSGDIIDYCNPIALPTLTKKTKRMGTQAAPTTVQTTTMATEALQTVLRPMLRTG